MYKISIAKRIFHFKQPAGTSRGVYTERKSWMVTISDGEASGVGECAPLPDLSCDALPDQQYEAALQQFCDQLASSMQIPYEEMRDYPSMLFGLETALLDMESKKNGNGLLFDTPFARGEKGITINGLVWMGSYEEMLGRMEEKLKKGFRCVKLKVGAIDFYKELDLVKRIRERFSHREVELRLDANGGFKPDEALYQLELLSQYAIHSIEQPIKQKQWAKMAELCRDAPLPIALDEELIGVNDPEMKRQMLRIIKPAYIVLKPSLHGGMMGCREWIDIAKEEGIGWWITSALESNIGLNAIAQFASSFPLTMPQGLGTGMLFTDNVPMPLEIKGDKLWISKNS
ncbi:o-succinylbenzoate synthase [Xylanibacter brevis]|uniref:o-succinylbenzoate synthase n=1 Tax=Xylanibacter brevis TaxID=83231 RepID=UPI0004808937|nr:o-succinylbenzoate synthase [Xylanibacter brevis]